MLYHVRMDVRPPHDIDPARFDALKAEEKARSQELQRAGKWLHLWRIAGQYSNVSIFDVADHDELHAILSALPLFPVHADRRDPARQAPLGDRLTTHRPPNPNKRLPSPTSEDTPCPPASSTCRRW